MKHLVLTLAIALMGTFGLCAAEAATDSIAYLKQIKTFVKTDAKAGLAKLEATKADVIASKNLNMQARWGIAKTLFETAGDTTSTFAQLLDKLAVNYKAVGVNPKTWQANQYASMLINPDYVVTIPEQRMKDGIAYLKTCEGVDYHLGQVFEKTGRVDEAIEVYKNSKDWGCMSRYILLQSKKDKAVAYAQWMEFGIQGRLFPDLANREVTKVLNFYLADPKTDRAALKQKLSTMIIIYSNKMTSDKAKADWNNFVAVLKNTVSLL